MNNMNVPAEKAYVVCVFNEKENEDNDDALKNVYFHYEATSCSWSKTHSFGLETRVFVQFLDHLSNGPVVPTRDFIVVPALDVSSDFHQSLNLVNEQILPFLLCLQRLKILR